MIKSDLELNVLEILDIAWMYVFIVNWVITFVAAAGIQPTVCVFVWVMSEFDEGAHLSHNLVSVANVRARDINSTTA